VISLSVAKILAMAPQSRLPSPLSTAQKLTIGSVLRSICNGVLPLSRSHSLVRRKGNDRVYLTAFLG